VLCFRIESKREYARAQLDALCAATKALYAAIIRSWLYHNACIDVTKRIICQHTSLRAGTPDIVMEHDSISFRKTWVLKPHSGFGLQDKSKIKISTKHFKLVTLRRDIIVLECGAYDRYISYQ
jgi:hypothetical protein